MTSDPVPLRSLVSSYIGGGWGKEEMDESHPEPAFVIRGTDFANASYGVTDEIPYRFHKSSNLRSRRLESDEILIEVSGGSIDQPVGRTMYVDEHVLAAFDGPVMCASFCKRVSPNAEAVYPAYLYWYLRAVYASGLIERYQVQSTGIRNLQFEYFVDDLPVRVPSRHDQEQAAQILDIIVDLSRINRRRIEILEEMARLIYRRWFVQFRFPGHDDVEFVDSYVGPIPKGWAVGAFGDLVEVSREAANPDEIEPGAVLVGLEHLPRRSTTLIEWDLTDDVGSRKSRFAKGDILFGKIRPYFHKVALAPVDGYCSTDSIVFRPEPDARGQALAVASSDEFVAYAVQTSNGTKMPRANTDVLMQYSVLIPPRAIRELFEAVVGPISSLCENLSAQMRVLSEARDLLLPRLISGELDVSGGFDLEPVA